MKTGNTVVTGLAGRKGDIHRMALPEALRIGVDIGSGLISRHVQMRIVLGPAFASTWFDSVGPIAHSVARDRE
jgi:hypothetical protein